MAPGETVTFSWVGHAHNVVELGEDLGAWEECLIPEDMVHGVAGPHTVTLPKEGVYYFVCGVAVHCSAGLQKAQITVAHHCP